MELILNLFLSDLLSDIKLQIIDSDHSLVISAHWAILIQNSEYFEGKFRDMKKKGLVLAEDEALVVDVKGLGTVQDVLDILTLFYLSIGKLIEQENPFKDLNPNILHYFMIRDVEFKQFDIFENIEFSNRNNLFLEFKGLLNSNIFFSCYFMESKFYIAFVAYRLQVKEMETEMKKYIEFTNHLKNYFDNNKIIYELREDAIAQSYFTSGRINVSGINIITIPLSGNENVKILFDDIKKKSDQKVKDLIDKEYFLK